MTPNPRENRVCIFHNTAKSAAYILVFKLYIYKKKQQDYYMTNVIHLERNKVKLSVKIVSRYFFSHL